VAVRGRGYEWCSVWDHPAQVIERLREYEAASAAWTILALRVPFDWEGGELFTREVMPAFAA